MIEIYEYLNPGVTPSTTSASATPTSTGNSTSGQRHLEIQRQLRTAELYVVSNRDRLVTLLTRALTKTAQQTAVADSNQQADLYLKAGGSLGPDDVFAGGGGQTGGAAGVSGGRRSTSRAELGRFLRLETSGGRFGALRPIYVSGQLRWVCERHYVELRSMPSIQMHLGT